jgi:Icc-related predicted phosphoesterase
MGPWSVRLWSRSSKPTPAAGRAGAGSGFTTRRRAIHKSMGDADLEQWIGQHNPDIVVAGHIHQSPFVKDGSWADRIGVTGVFNPGRQYGVLMV